MVRFKRAVEAAVKAVRNGLVALAAGAGSMFIVLILIVGVIGGVFAYSSSQSSASLSEQVLAYTATIPKVCQPIWYPGICPCDPGDHDAGIRREWNGSDAVQ